MAHRTLLSKGDWQLIAEKIMELGNLAIASLVFSQFFYPSMNISVLLVGIASAGSSYVCAILVLIKVSKGLQHD